MIPSIFLLTKPRYPKATTQKNEPKLKRLRASSHAMNKQETNNIELEIISQNKTKNCIQK